MDLQIDTDGMPYVMWDDNKIRLENGPVTDKKYKEKAEQELRETPENVEKGLEELRKLLRGEPDLVVPIEKDEFLMKFLRPCKFYAESAFKRMQAYYKFRLAHREQCFELTPSSTRVAFDNSIVAILSPRDQHGRRTMVVESANWNPREVTLSEVFRGIQMVLEAAIAEPSTQINGAISILDMRGLSFGQIMQFTPSFAKLIVDWIQDCVPLRLKAVHIINQPYIFNMLFAVFKPFLRPKLRSRIHFHGTNRDSLLAHVSANALRKRHGGTLSEPDIPGETLLNMLLHYEDDFKRANSYGYKTDNKKK